MITEDTLSERYANITDDPFEGFDLAGSKKQDFHDRWTGKVVDNKDSLKLGRVRVRIFGFYDDVADVVLPWAIPEGTYLGASSSNLVVPPVDSIVRGYFENGDPMKPIYTGIITSENPLFAAVESFLGMRSPGESIMDDAVNSDYPNTMVLMKTDDGEGVTLNRKTGLMKINHRSGLKIQIDPNGSISVEQSLSKKIDTDGPAKMSVALEGNFDLTANGVVNLNAMKDVNIDAVLGDVNLGRNDLKSLICAHPFCFVTGAPTNGGNTNVKA
jgi:hypothetical protein